MRPTETPATVGSALREAAARLTEAGSETPRLDAEVLLGHVLGFERATLLAHLDLALPPAQMSTFEGLIARRGTGEPVSYIRGFKEFYGLALAVDRRALIPRPETELVVNLALATIGRRLTESARPAGTGPYRVWDVGTGSGAIVVALAVESRRHRYDSDVRFRATDASPDALAVAVENAVGHGVADLIEFSVADLAHEAENGFDLVVANLPYVPSADIPTLPVAASFEPVSALNGGPDGLDVIRRLAAQLPTVLVAGGTALLEIGAGQADAVRVFVEERLPGWSSEIHPDLANVPRVVELTRPVAA
ncbi:MAG TPA: peptide chain release factor N(5)-glutamine methyltransferase [Candidatus Limnocylindrales bacterium]|nr:peptide chain release factor N(5)-glutamine methyltransferase [Candidatus Limnocylindrales bacterium]